MRRICFCLSLSAISFVFSLSIHAQQTGKIFRIGFLDRSTASGSAVLIDSFRQEISKLGWIEGKNVIIEYRFAEGKTDRLPELAAELVRLKMDLIVVSGRTPGLATKKATTTNPIVMMSFQTRWLRVWLPVWRGLEAMSRDCRV